MDKKTELLLIKNAQAGDRDAFGMIYDAYVNKVYGFILNKVRHRETAQDILSETFFKALQSIDGFRPSESGLSPWLFTIARNSVIDHIRRTHSSTAIEDVWELPSATNLNSETDFGLLSDSVHKAMQLLSTQEREIVTMRIWQDMSHAEISAVISKSEESTRAAYSRAMKKIRKGMPLTALLIFLLSTLHLLNK